MCLTRRVGDDLVIVYHLPRVHWQQERPGHLVSLEDGIGHRTGCARVTAHNIVNCVLANLHPNEILEGVEYGLPHWHVVRRRSRWLVTARANVGILSLGFLLRPGHIFLKFIYIYVIFFILFYFILFYFILFYFILFYFIKARRREAPHGCWYGGCLEDEATETRGGRRN